MYDTIVVGTDGSKFADRAVEQGMEYAERFDAELHAITVVNTRRYGEPALGSSELVLNELEDRAHRQLRQIQQQGRSRGIDTVTEFFHGTPSEEIIRYADETAADVVILGSRGRTHVGSQVGSTARRVVDGTDRAVLLV